MAPISIRILGASAKNRKVIDTLLTDMRGILGPFLGVYDGFPVTIKLGNEHFTSSESKCLGWHQEDEGKHQIALRPNMPAGQLYVVCMHELGHAMGLEHTVPGRIMSVCPSAGRWTKRLTKKRRVEWMTDFCKSVAGLRIKEG